MAELTVNEKKFRDLINRVDDVWMGELGPDHIKSMEEEVKAREKEILARASDLERKIKDGIRNHEVSKIEDDYNELRRLRREYGRLAQSRKQLYDRRQRRFVWHGVKKELTEPVAIKLEKIVLALIVMVLVILGIEFWFGYDSLDNEILFSLS
ncbi:MAG: hypothetical protein MJA83_20390, partial [Gammaproteobacteria bacterium]|nr:hypothetical protein [Gammaproteobacteria bacterium]